MSRAPKKICGKDEKNRGNEKANLEKMKGIMKREKRRRNSEEGIEEREKLRCPLRGRIERICLGGGHLFLLLPCRQKKKGIVCGDDFPSSPQAIPFSLFTIPYSLCSTGPPPIWPGCCRCIPRSGGSPLRFGSHARDRNAATKQFQPVWKPIVSSVRRPC